jgi:hypothetical protein
MLRGSKKKWDLLAEYIESTDSKKTYGYVLKKLVKLLDEFYLKRLLKSASDLNLI